MKKLSFESTRGSTPRVSAAEALLRGLAPDGGLYVPAYVPPLPDHLLRGADSIAEVGARVLPGWLAGDLSESELSQVSHDALNFPVPLVPLSGEWDGVHVLELFHGPTLSFKDFGARTMARLISRILPDDERVTILVATSGDTGSAVADGFSGHPNIDVILLYPQGQVSEVQERQLIVRRPGVQAYAVEGTFDDCQRMVKDAFASDLFEGRRLSSANSINIGRLIPQILYYLEASRIGNFTEAPTICVPSGNLGNLSAGVLAHLAGMPVKRFIAAHNANDFFPRFLSEGNDNYRESIRTTSNAMDVGVPSNFERLRHLLGQEDLRSLIHGDSVSDDGTLESMRRVYEEAGYVADPHTAVGLEAVRRKIRSGDSGPFVVMSTAHPAKFPDIVEQAIDFAPETPEALASLMNLSTSVRAIPAVLSAIDLAD
jgi:threonine synthase